VLDKRVLTKSYGRLFIESLPECTKQQGPLKELPKRAAAWIDRTSDDRSPAAARKQGSDKIA
jgi:hypothetical protein